ncbi:MAG: SpoIIE family protein phosphatase [Candidatus Wallbacteria bacterium]|nr:SpoIIE family protein phosphatase [Candidatus Wallbacteria bacterium]
MFYLSPKTFQLSTLLSQTGIRNKPLGKHRKGDGIALISEEELPELSGKFEDIVIYSETGDLDFLHNLVPLEIITKAHGPREIVFRLKNAEEALKLREIVKNINNELFKKDQELSTIHAFEENIKTTFIVDELLKMLVDVITRVLKCQRASVVLLQEEGRDLLVKGTIGSDQKKVENFQIKYRGRVTREIIRRKSSLMLRDISKLNWPKEDEDQKSYYTTNSFLSVPILVKNEVAAIINVTDKQDLTPFNDDDRRLLEIIASQVSGTIERFKMSHELLEKERLSKELAIAREIQINLLPAQNPDLHDVEATFFYQPCYSVGGDYFDFLELDNHQRALLIGDVSGKGVPASLLMVMIRSIICYAAQLHVLGSPEKVFQDLNDYLLKHSARNMFVTLFMGILDSDNGKFYFSNAGHNYPLLLKKGQFQELKTGDMILGLFDEASYHSQEIQIDYEDLLILYTDGISEARQSDGGMFGEAGIKQFFQENYQKEKPLNQTIDDFKQYFRISCGTADQADDATLILMRRKPPISNE